MRKQHKFILVILVLIIVFGALPALAEMIVDTAWVRTYNGPADSTDWALDMALDSYGNAHVTGMSWNGTDYDYATIRYQANGDTAWVRRFHSVSYYELCAIVVDRYGNVYVAGKIESGGWDCVTIKYYPDGTTSWVRTYNGPGDQSDAAVDITVDASDNILLTAVSKGAETDFDYATIKYYPNGDTAWIRRYNGPGNQSDAPHALTVDKYGNVYVTGGCGGSGTGDDFATIKYYPNGDTAWVRRYTGTGSLQDYANAIAVDSVANTYVTGLSGGTDWDIATIKYYPNGDTAWVRRYNGPANAYDASVAIAVDNSGNAFVVGATVGAGYDLATIKYYPNGDTAWIRTYDGSATGGFALAVSVDSDGNSYVSGSISGETWITNVTIKYYPNGDTAWVRRYEGTGGGFDWATDLALDDFGNVYVTSGAISDDYVTIKYFQVLRADMNSDGVINVGDVIYLINYLYRNGSAPQPLAVGDATCGGEVDIADVIFLINYLFKGGPPPSC